MAVERRLHLEAPLSPRHCEEQRDEAIQTAVAKALWIASLSLAMTVESRFGETPHAGCAGIRPHHNN
jgi:hypothetical protein